MTSLTKRSSGDGIAIDREARVGCFAGARNTCGPVNRAAKIEIGPDEVCDRKRQTLDDYGKVQGVCSRAACGDAPSCNVDGKGIDGYRVAGNPQRGRFDEPCGDKAATERGLFERKAPAIAFGRKRSARACLCFILKRRVRLEAGRAVCALRIRCNSRNLDASRDDALAIDGAVDRRHVEEVCYGEADVSAPEPVFIDAEVPGGCRDVGILAPLGVGKGNGGVDRARSLGKEQCGGRRNIGRLNNKVALDHAGCILRDRTGDVRASGGEVQVGQAAFLARGGKAGSKLCANAVKKGVAAKRTHECAAGECPVKADLRVGQSFANQGA